MQDSIKIYTDGGARGNPGPAAAAFVVYDNEQVIYSQSKYLGKTTNNVAEYWAVLIAVKWLIKNIDKIKKAKVNFYLDSQLVACQLAGKYKVKDNKLVKLFNEIKDLEQKSNIYFFYQNIPRVNNQKADELVNKKIDEKLCSFHVTD